MDNYRLEPNTDYQLVANNSTLYITSFAVIVLLSVILNLTLLFVFIRNPVIITPSLLYYINLACTNILFALFAMTFGVVTCMSGRWIFHQLVCQVVGFCHSLFIYVIMLTSFALSSERYCYRASLTRYNATYTTKRVGITIGLYWLISLLLSSIPLIPGLSSYKLHNNKATCFVPQGVLHYMLTLALFVYVILWTYVSYNTVFIIKISVPKKLLLNNNKRSSKYLPSLLTSGTFALISATYVTFDILHLFNEVPVKFVEMFEKVSFLLLYVTTLVQPLLILTLNDDIRSACSNLLSPSPLLELEKQALPPAQPSHGQVKRQHRTLDRYIKPQWRTHTDKRYMTLSVITEKKPSDRSGCVDDIQPITAQSNGHMTPNQPIAGQNTGHVTSLQQPAKGHLSSKANSALEIVEL